LNVRFRGTGAYVPPQKLTNSDLERRVETNDAWILARTGIRERGIAGPEMATSDLATRSAERALEMAGLQPEDVDLIVVATVTPDMLTPSAACLVHRNLRVGRPIPCLDLNAACSGFVYGLEVAGSLLAAGPYRIGILIGAETISRFVDPEDRATAILFGDAAGAVVLERSEAPGGLLATVLKSDGGFWDLIQLPGGGSRRPPSPYMLTQREHYVRMNGRQVFKLAVQALEQVAHDTLERAGWRLEDVDHVLVHQANRRIIEAVVERLGIPEEKVPINVDRTGNTSAASIPVLLDEWNRAGRLRTGDRILCTAFGAGLTWGGAALEWG
jgi:3-oxoacyl-[acyl-carrier-protein] synthase-3